MPCLRFLSEHAARGLTFCNSPYQQMQSQSAFAQDRQARGINAHGRPQTRTGGRTLR
jgi:hypothetical protein